MLELTWFISLLLVFNVLLDCEADRQVLVERFENCNPHFKYPALYNVTIRTVNNKQYLDGVLTLESPLDNTVRSNISVEKLTNKHSLLLLFINERKSCDALHKYMGEFIYDIERKAQMIPGMCPIPAGIHRVHDVLLDFKKFTTAESFPFGNLRFVDHAYKNNNIYSCLIVEVENLNI